MSVETPDYAAMLRRMIRAYGRRVAEGDPYDLGDMLTVRDELDRALRAAVAGHRETGFSWAEIGAGLGVTRQTAWQQYSSVGSDRTATVPAHDDAS